MNDSISALLKQQHPTGVVRAFAGANTRAFVSIVAAATSQNLYQLTPGKRAIMLSVSVNRRSGGNTFLQIGEGDFTARFPDLPVISGQTVGYTLDDGDFPALIFEADITMQAVAAAAANDNIRVFGTVFEF